jgi:hypothetical protein
MQHHGGVRCRSSTLCAALRRSVSPTDGQQTINGMITTSGDHAIYLGLLVGVAGFDSLWELMCQGRRGEGFAHPVLGVGEVLDEPEDGAARVEAGGVGGLGQVVEDVIGGVQQPLRDGLGVIEELVQVVGVPSVRWRA